jgi:hypothetical protein
MSFSHRWRWDKQKRKRGGVHHVFISIKNERRDLSGCFVLELNASMWFILQVYFCLRRERERLKKVYQHTRCTHHIQYDTPALGLLSSSTSLEDRWLYACTACRTVPVWIPFCRLSHEHCLVCRGHLTTRAKFTAFLVSRRPKRSVWKPEERDILTSLCRSHCVAAAQIWYAALQCFDRARTCK